MLEKRIDPVKTSAGIRDTYLRYLTTTFGLKNPKLAQQFWELARKSEGLFRGPLLEATPKYKQGKSLFDMLTEGDSPLSQEFMNYAPGLKEAEAHNRINLERPLYLHQAKALQKVIGENRNIVVSTGTGSGKTECFLLPIIDHLLKERASNRLGPGVRALLVYPMNALANDQVARLRRLLPPRRALPSVVTRARRATGTPGPLSSSGKRTGRSHRQTNCSVETRFSAGNRKPACGLTGIIRLLWDLLTFY